MILRPMQAAMDGRGFQSFMADWEAGRQRYFTIDWIQFATTLAAFALFLAALISLTG
jgi:hypothetical protein